MSQLLEIAKTGVTAITLRPLRSFVVFLALTVILVPWLMGMAMAFGVAASAQRSIDAGGDLYVSGSRFGRTVPLPRAFAEEVRDLPGVTKVVPRIIGRLALGTERVEVVAVGIPESEFPNSVTCIHGRLPKNASMNEFVAGTELASRLKITSGSLLPPFYRNRSGEHVSKIVGVFDSDIAMWQSHVLFSTLQTMEQIFNQQDLVTDAVIYCRSGYSSSVMRSVSEIGREIAYESTGPIRVRVVSRKQLNVALASSNNHWSGIFNLHFVLMFVVGILVVLVTTGAGLTERRHEIGILKAIGWQTDQILLRSMVEMFIISLGSASVSIIVAFVWLKVFNAVGVAAILLPGANSSPGFTVPFRLLPVPVLLTTIVACLITMAGSVWSTWRAAIVSPDEAMR